jgi:hypothetical protein
MSKCWDIGFGNAKVANLLSDQNFTSIVGMARSIDRRNGGLGTSVNPGIPRRFPLISHQILLSENDLQFLKTERNSPPYDRQNCRSFTFQSSVDYFHSFSGLFGRFNCPYIR